MTKGDLDTSLLLKIMKHLGESRNERRTVGTEILMREFVPQDFGEGGVRLGYLNRHVDFLRDIGLLTARNKGVYRVLELTAKGQMFVQPDLLGFEDQKMWPEVLTALEKEIQVLTYPQEEKDGMIYRLREAVASKVPDLIVKVIAEVFVKSVKL